MLLEPLVWLVIPRTPPHPDRQLPGQVEVLPGPGVGQGKPGASGGTCSQVQVHETRPYYPSSVQSLS